MNNERGQSDGEWKESREKKSEREAGDGDGGEVEMSPPHERHRREGGGDEWSGARLPRRTAHRPPPKAPSTRAASAARAASLRPGGPAGPARHRPAAGSTTFVNFMLTAY